MVDAYSDDPRVQKFLLEQEKFAELSVKADEIKARLRNEDLSDDERSELQKKLHRIKEHSIPISAQRIHSLMQ